MAQALQSEPCPLARREVALLLSCWKRWDTKSVAEEFGPDCEDSPCYGIRKMNVLEVMRLFGECGFEFLPETDLQRRPGLEVVMTVGLHLCALEMTDQQVDTLACIALAGQLPEFFPLLEWSYAVKKSFMSQEVVTCANRDQWNEVCTMLQEVSNTELSLRSKNGTTLWTRVNPCLPTPEDDAFPLQVLTPPPTRELARMLEVVQIEATGLGGKNLGVDRPWDISIRTDPEGQNVHGPSLATVEDIVIEPDESGGMSTKHVTSLGISKAAHEFLTLHYFALDSAEWWEQILGELLPNAQFPAAVIRRTIAYQMFVAAHIAPSHRRPPHPVWEDSLSLIADLLFGSGVDRYVGAMQRPDSPLEVNVRGFSAGSYSGLAFLHILWSIPRVTTKGCLGAIACPPALLSMSRAKRADRLHLIHYENDSLCSWKPGLQQIQGCCTSFTYITNEIASYKGHFGPDDHDYSHWMALELPHGSYALRVLLFIRPAAASKARRDATPLRLISWLSYKLNPELEQFIEKAMEHLSTWTETEGGKVLTMGKEAIPRGGTVDSEEELRNELIELISVGNLKYKPQALFTLFRQFLTRISLPRLIHFMDLVLPQLTPVQAAWAGEEKTLWSCHYIRWLRGRHSDATPRVQISYLFSSHDNIHHVRIQWNSNPLLLFTDPTMVEALPVEHFSQQASHMTHQQHLQMGLRKGMAILIYYVIGNTHYQAVLLAEESVMNRGKRGENRLWKRVTPTVTEFAWLPPNLAESFCKNALYRDDVRTYCAFDTPHLGLDTKNFVADVFVENILYLGDTRSADDLSVFTKMAPERLCLGCGLRVDEPFAPISTGERKKLFYAAQKLLTFVLHEVSAQTLSAEETALKIVYCARSVMFVGTSLYVFPKTFWIKVTFICLIEKFSPPTTNPLLLLGKFYGHNSLDIHEFSSISRLNSSSGISFLAAVHFDGTCECILSRLHRSERTANGLC